MTTGNPFSTLDDKEFAVLEMVISRAVGQGVEEGIVRAQQKNCLPHFRRTDSLEAVVFGHSENGITGLDERINRLEAFERRVTRLTWMVASSILISLVTLGFSLFTQHTGGGP